MNEIVTSVVALGGLGLAFGVGLGVVAKAFHVPVDEKVEKIRSKLPGANCGACGFPGCDGLAEAIASGEAPVNGCPVGGSSTASDVAAVMGTDAGESTRLVAKVKCNGKDCYTFNKFEYEGISDCRAAALVAGGSKSCSFGCLGLGSCEISCAFDSIEIKDGIARINPETCTSCGQCIETCPKDLIEIIPYEQKVIVDCSNQEIGKAVKSVCEVGCIGCKMCVKVCPFDAMKFDNGVAHIDYEKCTNCMLCAEKCPTKAIEADFSLKKVAFIEEDKCVGCTICKKNCPVEAISGELKSTHIVDPSKCIGCSVCEEKCPKDAIIMKTKTDA